MTYRSKARVPSRKSLLLSAVLIFVVYFARSLSPVVGYFLALLAMVMIVVASATHSVWPSKRRAENPFVFALFWALMIGLLLPFVVSKYLL